MTHPRIAPFVDIDPRATIGPGTVVWHFAQIREHAVVGRECVVGRGAYIDSGVVLGDRCKIQNYALAYEPARLGTGVFVGPAAILTNDSHPRAVTTRGDLKRRADWEPAGVVLEDGCAVGAGAVVLPGVTVGEWASVGAGAVVTRDVAAFALVVGTPARQVGWVGRAGVRLVLAGEGRWRCPRTEVTYLEEAGRLEENT